MHESYWGLQESPFRHAVDPRYFFSSPTHQEALARMHFLVDEGRPLGVLTGDEGSGKSSVMQMLKHELRGAGPNQLSRATCYVNLFGLDIRGFLWSLAVELDINPRPEDDEFTLWRGISDRLQENDYQQISTVLLFDDADQASEQVMVQVLRLLKCHHRTAGDIVLILAAETDRLTNLKEELLELTELRIHLEAWEQADINDYLESSLERAGRDETIFEQQAILRLHELSGGRPREISRLAELALVAGAGGRLHQIDAHTIDSVYNELSGPRRETYSVTINA